MKIYYIYILTTKLNKLLYVGVTNNLERRMYEHQNKLIDGYTKKYNVNKLIYYEECSDIKEAINREKQFKGRTRKKKELLINTVNSEWKSLL